MIEFFTLIVLFFSIVIHELAHGSVALSLGDETAKRMGRLTLNPLKHIDPLGTIILPLGLFILTAGQGPIIGWAKPVPINLLNFRDQKWGLLKVSLAGPAVNLFLGTIFALSIRFFNLPDSLSLVFSIIVIYNFVLGLFNLIPLPPFDGSHILFSLLPRSYSFKRFLEQYGLIVFLFFILCGGLDLVFLGAYYLFAFMVG